ILYVFCSEKSNLSNKKRSAAFCGASIERLFHEAESPRRFGARRYFIGNLPNRNRRIVEVGRSRDQSERRRERFAPADVCMRQIFLFA
ncbi:MAG: hypothetical protein ACI4NG_04330, partial [Candidatus Gallimonas sp.]